MWMQVNQNKGPSYKLLSDVVFIRISGLGVNKWRKESQQMSMVN